MKDYYIRFLAALSIMVILALSLTSHMSQAQRVSGNLVPAQAEFLSDTTGGKLISDGRGAYSDGKAQCVTANVSSAGYFYLRTATNGCRSKTPRLITIDFTNGQIGNPINCPSFVTCPHAPLDDDFNQAGALDVCGSNSLGDVTIRATRLFANPIPANQLTEVQIDLNLATDFKHTAFYLIGAAYIQLGTSPNERLLTTGSDRSEFYLVMVKQNGERVCLGNYFVPFTIAVNKGI
jgi:hypothetical protein